MSFVIRYGNRVSENGWRMVDEAECAWSKVPGTNVSLQIRQGIPTIILVNFAKRFNETIEPLRDPDSACWTPTNDVGTSNHLSGTGMDLNWNTHPFLVAGTFGNRLNSLRRLLDEFRGCVWWGGDWQSPIDEMHFQLNYAEGYFDDNGYWHEEIDQRLIDLANDLQPLPEPNRNKYIRAVIREGQRLNITPRGIIIAIVVMLVETNIQMYANSNDPPSLEFPHDAVGSDHMSSGLFQQQPWWGSLECRMDATCSAKLFFVQAPPGNYCLTDLDYNNEANTPGYYAQKVQGSAYPDRYDQRWDEACAIYDEFVTALPELGDDMAAVSQEEWIEIRDKTRQIWGAIFNPVRSKSKFVDYSDPGEIQEWASKDFWWNDDGFEHEAWVIRRALNGDPDAIKDVRRCAEGGDVECQTIMAVINNATLPANSSLPNDYQCLSCGKFYPSVLNNCPFCGAAQGTEATAASTTAPAIASVATPASTPGSLPPVDQNVVDQLVLLKHFGKELPEAVDSAIDYLIPIMQGLVDGGKHEQT